MSESGRKKWKRLGALIVEGGISFLVATLVNFLAARYLDLWLPKLTAFFHIWWLTLVGTLIVLLIGWGLYLFKNHHQSLYGVAEIGFALAVAWASIMRVQSTKDATSWLATLAAAYLIVRGLSNYYEGKEPETAAA